MVAFGNMKAVFEYFGNKTLGITYPSLRSAGLPYENTRCRITKLPIFSIKLEEVISRREKEGRPALPKSDTSRFPVYIPKKIEKKISS